ncbi:hypothetical protein BBJ28_00022713, partial [Nothophytophthora sp. Chile5]
MEAKAQRKAETKRLATFFAPDRPPRKRVRALLDFLQRPADAGGGGRDVTTGRNIAVAMQSLLSGGSKAAGSEHAAAVLEFWADASNSALLFVVLSDCVAELETLYTPHEWAFRKLRMKSLEVMDWSEVFEGLEVLLRNNGPRLRDGWNNDELTLLFVKLLKRDNHTIIKKYAFRCLALFTDATRNLPQLASMTVTSSSSFQAAPCAGSTLSDGGEFDVGCAEDEASDRSTVRLAHAATQRKNMHLELLRESVDFSPYGGGNILLPDKFLNDGVHVEGWKRSMPTPTEEPVDMLKFIMDLSLEREKEYATTDLVTLSSAGGKAATYGDSSGNSDRFAFWSELIMKFYMPLLYPKVCIKVKLKEDGDTLGFFHHCPGSFQRVVARWVYKLRSKEDFMEVLWSRCEFSEVVMETIRQRFAYRDTELVVDAINIYSGICTGAQYVPSGMKVQMNECLRAMITHVSQLFHPSVQLDDPTILFHCIELLELVSQHRLDDYTSTYLRAFVLSTIDNTFVLREPGNRALLTAMLSIVLHVWMHASVIAKDTDTQIWLELSTAIHRWLTDTQEVGAEIINCWTRELRFASCLVIYVMDKGYSNIKVTSERAMLLSHDEVVEGGKDEKVAGSGESLRDTKQVYLQSSANFLMSTVVEVSDATRLLERVLHLIPPPTVSTLSPTLHFSLSEELLQVVELWIDAAIDVQHSTLQQISPSTVLDHFGEWVLPACELEAGDFQKSRWIVALCKLCAVRGAEFITPDELAVLVRVLFKGITSPSGVVVSTVLQKSSVLFALNLEGLNILVPAYLYVVDEVIISSIYSRAKKAKVKSSEWNKELTAALDVMFAVMELPKRVLDQDWKQKIQTVCGDNQLSQMQDIIDQIPDPLDDFHIIVGRLFMRIAQLPFTDVVEIKKRALWGLYCLIVVYLKAKTGDKHATDPIHLSIWIVHLIDMCQDADISISTAALSILQNMTDCHKEINAFDPLLVARIVMTIASFDQPPVHSPFRQNIPVSVNNDKIKIGVAPQPAVNASPPPLEEAVSFPTITEQLGGLLELSGGMAETQDMCEDVLERLQRTQYRLDAVDEANALPETTLSLHRIGTCFHAFLSQHTKKSAFERLVSTRVIVGLLRGFHCEIDEVEDQLTPDEDGGDAAEPTWKEKWEAAEHAVEDRLVLLWRTKPGSVLSELPDTKTQTDALLVLNSEAVRHKSSYNAKSQQLLQSVTKRVARMSGAPVPAVPEWFIPDHEVQRGIRPFDRGSFGEIYRGTWRGLKVVVKCVTVTSDYEKRTFLREAKIWHKAKHANIVKFFGACHLSRPCFFVCEEAENGNLVDYLDRMDGADPSLVWRLLHEVALGLQ